MINEDSLLNAIVDAKKQHHGINANIQWNNGTLRCFLYDGQWFPLRAVMNHAHRLQDLPADPTTDECERNLRRLLFPLEPVVADILLIANQLADANVAEQIDERNRKRNALHSLSKKIQLIQGNA